MTDIIITEFLEPGAVDILKQSFKVHWDAELWNKRGELEKLVRDLPGLIVRNRTPVEKAMLDLAPRLKVVGRLGVGLDNIDVKACEARSIEVCSARGANATSVAEYAIAMAMILLRRRAYLDTHRLVAGEWPREEMSKGRENFGRRFGIIGFGSIGQIVGEKAQALGMEVVAYDGYIPESSPV